MDVPVDLLKDFPFEDDPAESFLYPHYDFDNLNGSSKQSTGSKDDLTDEKKKERLERNREIARKCRKRKRERADALSEEVNRLRETNRKLEIQLKMCQSQLGKATSGRGNRGVEEENRRLTEIKHLANMVEQRFSDDEVKSRLENYTEMYADFGEERRNVVKVCLGQLEKLLLPTQVSKMLLWILEQDDEFFSSKEKHSVWNTLVEEVGLDDRQKNVFLSQRTKLGTQNTGMKLILHKLKELGQDIETNMHIRRKQVFEITKEISPIQQAKFLNWVEHNQACIHLLDNLWLQRTNSNVSSTARDDNEGVNESKAS